MSQRKRRWYPNHAGVRRLNRITEDVQRAAPPSRDEQLQLLAQLYGTHPDHGRDLFDQADRQDAPASP